MRALLGRLGEAYAVALYKSKGFVLVARNSYNRTGKQLGEIDFVAVKGNNICFVEVKTRSSTRFGLPELSVNQFKQQRLIRIVQWFLSQQPAFRNFTPQIDICAILVDRNKFAQNSKRLDKSLKYVKVYTNAVEMKY